MSDLSRARFAAGSAAALASIGIIRAPARAAQFDYKFATNITISHPLSYRAVEMWERVRKETDGKLDVKVFPNNQLGGDTAMLSQLRSGALQFFTLSGGILINVVEAAGIQGVPFAFKDNRAVYAALDGAVGAYVRKEIEAKGLFAMPKILENGFRQITNSVHPVKVVGDLGGLKIRTPAGKLWVDLFKSLGAEVTPLNISETYTAMQTHVVDGQENPYNVIEFNRFFEVQKYCSVSNHMWDGYWLLANGDAWKDLGPDIQAVVLRNAEIYARDDRRDTSNLNASLADKLARQGLAFNQVDTSTFKPQLKDFYARWKGEFGPTLWGLLEQSVGTLA